MEVKLPEYRALMVHSQDNTVSGLHSTLCTLRSALYNLHSTLCTLRSGEELVTMDRNSKSR